MVFGSSAVFLFYTSTDMIRFFWHAGYYFHTVLRRTQEHLLNFYETKQGQKNVPGKLVKSFSRSAAGIKSPHKSDLRTAQALKITVEYLLKDIILDKRKSFHLAYDFIFDRLRCVRQEIVMQNLDYITTIQLLEPVILFLAYSNYRLCEESIDNFDPKICGQHLQECLKKVLCCYDELDNRKTNRNLKEEKNRVFIESLYQVFNLGSTEALDRSIKLHSAIRKNCEFNLAQNISLEYFRGNYYRAIYLINKLPHILCATGALKIQLLRQKIYQSFSFAYNNKQLLVPVEFLKKILLQSSNEDILSDCKYYNIEIKDNLNINFSKIIFDSEKPIIKSKHEYFAEEKIKLIYLPEVLLLKKL